MKENYKHSQNIHTIVSYLVHILLNRSSWTEVCSIVMSLVFGKKP